jgi:hypothetical protein
MKIDRGFVAIVIGICLIIISVFPFAASAIQSDPSRFPPARPPVVQRSASATFGLPDISGRFLGQYGKITYTIVSAAIVPNVPLRVAAKVEIPMYLTAEWKVGFIEVALDNAVENGWPIINGTKQAQISIVNWEKATPSIFLYDAWASSEVVNFTSEGYVGGQVELSWTPSCWSCFDWVHLGNLTDIKIPTSTSLAIESSQAVEARYQVEVSSARNDFYAKGAFSVAIFLGGIGALVAGLLYERSERRKTVFAVFSDGRQQPAVPLASG